MPNEAIAWGERGLRTKWSCFMLQKLQDYKISCYIKNYNKMLNRYYYIKYQETIFIIHIFHGAGGSLELVAPLSLPCRGPTYMYIYIYIHTHTYTYMYMCICIYIERERYIMYIINNSNNNNNIIIILYDIVQYCIL